MAYLFASLQKILDVFDQQEGGLGATEISEITGKSTVIIHKYLKELVGQGKLKKVGVGPKTKYVKIYAQGDGVSEKYEDQKVAFPISFSDKKLMDEIFLKFSVEGKILKGLSGMEAWCRERGLNTEKKVQSYLNIHKHITKIQNECGLIDAKIAFSQDAEKVYLDEIYYADQYKWMDFGRGKLAEMTFYGKQSQNKTLISQSIDEVIGKMECLIGKEKYTAIAIVPWSIDRKNQLLKILRNRLKEPKLPFINVIKYYPSGISIPQKSLKTREQRIQNARNTIFVDDKNIVNYDTVLLIDDFVGSGSTLNETAKKLKQLGVKKVDGFAFVGNLNLNYDVINEI